MSRPHLSALGAALLCLAATDATAGWRASQTHSSPKSSTSQQVELLYGHHHLRIETKGDDTTMVIDLRTGDLTMIRASKKLYAQATLQDLVKMRDEMKATMKKRLASMPKEMRAQLEKMIEEQEAAQKKPLKVDRTKRTDKVSGFACRYFEWSGPEGTGEACIAKKLPVSMEAFRADAKKLTKRLEETGAGSAAATSVELLQLADHGFPVKSTRTVKMGPQTFESTAITTKVVSADLPKSTFMAPKGFKKATFQDFMQLSQPGPAAPR